MRNRTDYLKGIAILAVMLGHWFGPILIERFALGGNAFVSIFFFLSGYGNYHSLRKGMSDASGSKGVVLFFLKRAARLYPLYWLVLLPRYFSKSGVSEPVQTFLAINFDNPEYYWFVPAILLCYLCAPFLFWVASRTSSSLAMLLLFVATGITGAVVWGDFARIWGYRAVLLNGVLIFYLGLLYAKHQDAIKREFSALVGWGLVIALIIVAYESRHAIVVVPYHKLISGYVVTFLSVSICVVFVQSHFSLFLEPLIARFGAASYGLYLLHPLLFLCVRKIPLNEALLTVSVIVLLPVFLLLSSQIETRLGKIVGKYIYKPASRLILRSS